MKNRLNLLTRISIFVLVWIKFHCAYILLVYRWYKAIIKANVYSKLYRRVYFIIRVNSGKYKVVNYTFVGRHNDRVKKFKLNLGIKKKKITVSDMEKIALYKTK